jgi:branched-chain amino acid aminotransferase
MIASEVFLGVKPSAEYLYMVIASAAGNYFKSGAPAIKIWVSEHYTRAAPGGTGAAKCGGNYASSLVAQSEAIRNGCDQVVFLDAAEHRWIEELGGMNLFFSLRMALKRLPNYLPGYAGPLSAFARRGLTLRKSLFHDHGADAKSGRPCLFACGTAAVVTPIGKSVRKFYHRRGGRGSQPKTQIAGRHSARRFA